MRRVGRSFAVVVLVAGLGGLVSCSMDEPESQDPAAARTPPEPTVPASTTATPSPSDAPAASAPLDWSAVSGPTTTAVTVSGPWTLSLPENAHEAVLDGPERRVVKAPGRHRITDALIDGEYAVVVAEDERAQQPNVATVVDLGTGKTFTVDGRSDVPTTTGGTWALGDGHLLHATEGPGASYCLATVDLATRTSEVTWCAPARHGFNGAHVSAAGTTLMSFDASRPSCRTVGEIRDGDLAPFDDVPECIGWDALLLDETAVWSVAAKTKRIEEARFSAGGDQGVEDLGAGTSGSLVGCGGAAYFVRDPQRDDDPARLMRWAADTGLTVAYETDARGGAFLAEPRCGGDSITLTALTREGDEQVTASVR